MPTPQSAIVAAGTGATINLFRLACDLIVEASKKGDKPVVPSKKKKKDDNQSNGNGSSSAQYGSVDAKSKKDASSVTSTSATLTTTETTSLIDSEEQKNGEEDQAEEKSSFELLMPNISLGIHVVLMVFFITACVLSSTDHAAFSDSIYDSYPLGCAASALFIGTIMNLRDRHRLRFGVVQRTLYIFSALVLFMGAIFLIFFRRPTNNDGSSKSITMLDRHTLVALLLYTILAILESRVCSYPGSKQVLGKKVALSRKAVLILLKPYFWPDATDCTAVVNRILATLTWFCVVANKASNLIAPVYLGKATTALSRFDYSECVKNAFIYAAFQLCSKFFKESQSLVYLKVAQAAFVQLAEVTFHHLHSLSLDWHLKKRLGEVIRSMDRGISACDTLMKYLFLWLIPAIGECISVCIIFATYFKFLPLSVSVFFFVFIYMVMTIVLTLWRKKFRKAVAKSDNDWHDICTDSLINFETVKYFTAENYEMNRFGKSVKKFQAGSVSVSASLSLLNILQQVVYNCCLATTLSLAAVGIKQRADCCFSLGCALADFSCCEAVSWNVCPGMEVGDFVSVLTYTINLFSPLNFLGSVYNAIVMAIIDLTNLSELLAENPDLMDAPDAIALPASNFSDPATVVEFDNVFFNYPSQAENCGLKGMSFVMKKGTVTAIVGPTGAGKTTVSRLFFRFYDVLGGAVKMNGVNVRTVTQKSLRAAIGVVPQTTTLFNESIRDNVLYGKRDATQEDLDQVAKDAQLEEFISSLPDGWDTLVGDRGLKLSGGEKQRVSIARCLLKNPQFVVLDEATSALDTVTENSVQESLDRLGEDRTCLVIAHRLGTIRNADNIIVLDEGVVAEQGTHDELLELDGKYAELWNMQLHSNYNSSSSLRNLDATEE